MTKQESFKRRVRARMEKTGERYAAARRALIQQADEPRKRVWVAQPEVGDDAVSEATGKGWEQWCDIIDCWAGQGPGAPVTDHTAIAAHLQGELGVDPWWAQTVTVGYERITGLRLPYQRPDGTFTAGKSATVTVDGEELRRLLLSDADRPDLFPGHDTALVSRPEAKRMRFSLGPGVVQITIDPTDRAGRHRIGVSHEKLPTFDEVEVWKHYWGEWLAAIGDPSSN